MNTLNNSVADAMQTALGNKRPGQVTPRNLAIAAHLAVRDRKRREDAAKARAEARKAEAARQAKAKADAYQTLKLVMSRSCHEYGEDLHWAVVGGHKSSDFTAGGVLAWCWDKEDAERTLKLFQAANGYEGNFFSDLSVQEM